MVVKHDNTTRFLDRKDGHEHELTSGILVNTCHGVVYTSTVCNIHWYPIIIYNLHNIYTWKTVWTFFLSIMGFTRNGRFFCSIAYFGFWLWRVVQILWQHRVRTSSDNFQKRNFSPKWSKLGVVIGHPNLATNTAIFPTKFGCTHKIPVFFQHNVEKKQ